MHSGLHRSPSRTLPGRQGYPGAKMTRRSFITRRRCFSSGVNRWERFCRAAPMHALTRTDAHCVQASPSIHRATGAADADTCR
jgi:hypothetical protein